MGVQNRVDRTFLHAFRDLFSIILNDVETQVPIYLISSLDLRMGSSCPGPNILKKLKFSDAAIKAFDLKVTPKHCLPTSAGDAYWKSQEPRHILARRKYDARQDPLWWTCLTPISEGGKKRIVRSWLNNRVRVAIAGALHRKGYAKNGSRLPQSSDSGVRGELVGTVEFRIRQEALKTSWAQLNTEADLAISRLEKELVASDVSGFRKNTW